MTSVSKPKRSAGRPAPQAKVPLRKPPRLKSRVAGYNAKSRSKPKRGY